MNPPRLLFFTPSGASVGEIVDPMRVEILARFGAEDCKTRVVLDRTDDIPNLSPGDGMEVRFGDLLKFRGKVAELRTASHDPPLVITGMRRLGRQYTGEVRGLYENQTPTDILQEVLTRIPGEVPLYDGLPESDRLLDRLDFQGIPLFYAVDLLAKLAGNWLWWIDWDNRLHFIPPDTDPEWVWSYNPDRMVLRPGTGDHPVKNRFAFFGGVSGGAETIRYFEDAASRERFGPIEERLFVRGITTDAVYGYLRDAVLAQAPLVVRLGMVERTDGDLATSFGERFELRGDPLFPLFEDSVHRIAAEEILWTPDNLSVRYHLAERFESASRYTRYIDHDPSGDSYVAAHLGRFTLDLSALDSEAHLDS